MIALFIGCSISSGNLTKAQCIRHGIAAYTVRTVDSSCYLAGCIESGDYLAMGINYFPVAIDLQTAHGMMNRR